MINLLSNPIVSQFLGLLIGLFTSFFSWWVLFHGFAPKISLSAAISKSRSKVPLGDEEDKSGIRYRIKLENSGWRPVIDLEVRVFVRIKGLIDSQPKTWDVVHLAIETNGEKIFSSLLMNPVRKSKVRTVLRICINNTNYNTGPRFPQPFWEKAAEKALTLEDLLSLGAAAELRVIISGFDALTGARKVTMRTYLATDIKLGMFERDSLAIEREVTNPLT